VQNQATTDTLLHAALEIQDERERAAYLDVACAGDVALREDVESLIEAYLEAGTFMDSAVAPIWHESPMAREKDTIGRYQLRHQLGEGGYGTIYLAEQRAPVKREVALKLIKPGMDSREIIARFEAERQALALMDHPHIAKVYDAGTTDGGRPYFVMELVKGLPITEYCVETNLDLRGRLHLFTDVCAAVQHAHQKGIIHRDLKPSNILVAVHDGQALVKVIDFGIAKAIGAELTDKTILTQQYRMMGTPQYMSPEQAEHDAMAVDTRTDIYSLGVVLYELLTGTTPLDSGRLRDAGYSEMQRMIREETPPKPSTKLANPVSSSAPSGHPLSGFSPRAMRGGLDWIVLKALEKDPDRRYESVGAMADDIVRFLDFKPVNARPPSLAYVMSRFTRRYRGAVIAAAALFLTLVLGVLGTTIGMRRALDANAQLLVQNETLDQQKQELIDYKERLAGMLESNQKMLGEIARMNTLTVELPANFEALQKENQALLDKVGNEVATQERYAQEIHRLKAEIENLLSKNKELDESIKAMSLRPVGKFTGSITFDYPARSQGRLQSMRTLSISPDGKNLILTSVDRQLDAAGREVGDEMKSVVELLGAWDGAVFRSKEQRVVSTDFNHWAQEHITLYHSPPANRIDWISTFKIAGNNVVGKGVLSKPGE